MGITIPGSERVTDSTILSFGIHKGKAVGNVPARYLLFLYDQKRLPENLKAYIVENYDVLKKQEMDECEQEKAKWAARGKGF